MKRIKEEEMLYERLQFMSTLNEDEKFQPIILSLQEKDWFYSKMKKEQFRILLELAKKCNGYRKEIPPSKKV